MALPPCHADELFGSANVGSLFAFGAGGDVEAYALVFFEGLETLALNRRKMREEIFAAAVRSYEAEAFGIVEPLYSACCHVLISLKNKIGLPRKAKAKMA
jgi:hypothetical protein